MGIFNILMHIYSLIHEHKFGDIKYMTVWNYSLCSIYLILITICDTLFFFNKKNLELFNYILREIISPILSTNTYLVTITFWFAIKLIEEIKGKDIPNHKITNLKNIYIHLVISILITIDTILQKKMNINLIKCIIYMKCYLLAFMDYLFLFVFYLVIKLMQIMYMIFLKKFQF